MEATDQTADNVWTRKLDDSKQMYYRLINMNQVIKNVITS